MRLGASIGRADPATLTRRATDYESAGIDILRVAELYRFDDPGLMGFPAAHPASPDRLGEPVWRADCVANTGRSSAASRISAGQATYGSGP